MIDDDDWVRLSTRAQLEAHEWEVVEAADGEHAVSAFRARRDAWRFVLLDIKLPGMNSMDVARELRLVRADVPILVYSGYERWQVDPALLALPRTGFLTKPFGTDQLREELGQLGVEL